MYYNKSSLYKKKHIHEQTKPVCLVCINFKKHANLSDLILKKKLPKPEKTKSANSKLFATYLVKIK